ncbi:MmcQ/YjbR family DNA-binding protein [Lachnospiraceae bacterium 46-61]
MYKDELIKYITENYGVYAEFPWEKYPNNIVFRHNNNKKWFVLIMTVSKEKLGISECGLIDIMNVKCETIMVNSFRKEKGIYAAYHMNKTNWISVALDDSVSNEKVKTLIDMSFCLTSPKIKKNAIKNNF